MRQIIQTSSDQSHVVVISWWSNALGLACLHHLVKFIKSHKIRVIQVGKTLEQQDKFRRYIPADVTELIYPNDAPADHCKVLENIVFKQLNELKNLWILDHDVFINADCDGWLSRAESWFEENRVLLALPISTARNLAITNPAFWISPQQIPHSPTFFDPVPFEPRVEHKRPDKQLSRAELRIPEKDTMVQARDTLEAQGQVAYFPLNQHNAETHPLDPFPVHSHYGGLSLFTLHPDSSLPRPWVSRTVKIFSKFFNTCSEDWLQVEDPVLLERLKIYQEYLENEVQDSYPFEDFPREILRLGVPRRKILSAVITEMFVFSGKQDGGKAEVLSELGIISDKKLALITPIIISGSLIEAEDGTVYGTPVQSDQRINLFSLDSPALSVFNLFNGSNSLDEVTTVLTQEMGWPYSRAFAYTRGVFLALVVVGLAIPKNPS